MNSPDYLKLTVERVHEALNFRRNHRFFLVYGKNIGDEFLTRSLYRANLRQTLWATLKANNFQRIIFFNTSERFFFLDAESARLAVKSDNPAAANPVITSTNRRQVGPLGAKRRLLRPESEKAKNPDDSSRASEDSSSCIVPDKDGVILFTQTRSGGMSDAAVLTHFNDFFTDETIRTALVIEELENLSEIEHTIKRELKTRMNNWSALRSENRNVLILTTAREPNDEAGQDAMRRFAVEFPNVANLVNVALGEKNDQCEDCILRVPAASLPEIKRLLDETRLKYKFKVDWHELDKLAQTLEMEKKSVKQLDGLLREYAAGEEKTKLLNLEAARQRRWISGAANSRPAIERLHELIGLREVKAQVQQFFNLLKNQAARRQVNPALQIEPPNLHLVFTGNPGTGKTEVARLLGEIYRDLGLLRRGHTVVCTSKDLIAGYIGQSATGTDEKIDEALDGVLFVDEAYLLNDGTEYGEQAIGTIVARMENERHRLAVVMAGYAEDMNRLKAVNVGLDSRPRRTIEFPDYQPDELLEILELMLKREGYVIDDKMRSTMLGFFNQMYARRSDPAYFPPDKNGKSSFANARTVRNLIQAMIEEQATRLDGKFVNELTVQDIPTEYRKYLPPMQPDNQVLDELLEGWTNQHATQS